MTSTHPLARMRTKQHLSREALGALAGLSPRTIYAIEHDHVWPQRATIRVLCDALHCEPGEIGLINSAMFTRHVAAFASLPEAPEEDYPPSTGPYGF